MYEWLHILLKVIQCVCSTIELRQHQFSMKVSHDVDASSCYGFKTPKALIKSMAGDIIKRRGFKSVLAALLHPRMKKILEQSSLDTGNLTIIDPEGYLNMVWFINNFDLVMTDSVGLQKEFVF